MPVKITRLSLWRIEHTGCGEFVNRGDSADLSMNQIYGMPRYALVITY